MRQFLAKLKSGIEQYIPMTIGNLVIFCFLIYLIVVVGRTMVGNFNSNKEIEKEEEKLVLLERRIINLQNEINYYQTQSFKEKEARQKLGYKAVGEKVIALPIDTVEDKMPDNSLPESQIKVPNYTLWWKYFFGR